MELMAVAGRWTLIAVVIALALIGVLHLTRGTAVRHVRGVGAERMPIAVSEPQFPLNVTMLTGAWLAPGNRVEVALNGDGTFPRLWADLRSAQESITLQLYYGAPGRMAQTLAEILLDGAKAGVRVVVLYDAFGTVDIPANHRDALRAGGVFVEPFGPMISAMPRRSRRNDSASGRGFSGSPNGRRTRDFSRLSGLATRNPLVQPQHPSYSG